MLRTKVFTIVGLVALIIANPLLCAAQANTDPAIAAIGDIVSARDQIRGYVLDVKGQYKADSPEYGKARDLYRAALGKYNGWSIMLSEAIAAGKSKKLTKDDNYKKIATDASAASTSFVTYVESLRGQTKGIAILGSLVDVGFRIWNGIKDQQKKDRAAQADRFKADAKWEQWEDIKAAEADKPK